MPTLQEQFEAAVADSGSLSQRPDNPTLLKLYALYKQATQGDAPAVAPGFSDLVARAKWDAWNTLRGHSTEQAMQAYIDLIGTLD